MRGEENQWQKSFIRRGRKPGIYDAPYVFAGEDAGRKIPGAPGHTYEEILLRTAGDGSFRNWTDLIRWM